VSAIPDTLAELRVPIGSVKPYRRNPRRGNLGVIRESLRANGQYRPLVVNRRTSEVLAGNHTLAGALAEGWTEIAVTYVDVDDEQAARIVLVDNRSSDLAVYDDQALVDLLDSLPSLEATGFTGRTLDSLIAELEAGGGGEDRDTEPMEPPAKARSKVGEVYQLGEHRIACGDAVDPGLVRRLLDGAEPSLLVTDPPYGVLLDLAWRERAGYLAMMSRLHDRIVSVAVKGPSSAGKSYVIARVLRLFLGGEHYYAYTGMSERALVFGEEDLRHRMLVLWEAEGLEEGFHA
jgi:hypothetical protein